MSFNSGWILIKISKSQCVPFCNGFIHHCHFFIPYNTTSFPIIPSHKDYIKTITIVFQQWCTVISLFENHALTPRELQCFKMYCTWELHAWCPIIVKNLNSVYDSKAHTPLYNHIGFWIKYKIRAVLWVKNPVHYTPKLLCYQYCSYTSFASSSVSSMQCSFWGNTILCVFWYFGNWEVYSFSPIEFGILSYIKTHYSEKK